MTIHFPSETDIAAQLATGRQQLTRRIQARSRATRIAVIGGVVLAASSWTAATLVVAQASQQTIATGITCYAHDDLSSFSSGAALPRPRGSPPGARTWRRRRNCPGSCGRAG